MMTIEAQLTRIADALEALLNDRTGTPAKVPEPPKPEAKPAKAAKPEAEAKEEKPAPKAKAKATATLEDVKTIVLRVGKERGRDAAVALLGEFGVDKITSLKPEQYADAVARAAAVLA